MTQYTPYLTNVTKWHFWPTPQPSPKTLSLAPPSSTPPTKTNSTTSECSTTTSSGATKVASQTQQVSINEPQHAQQQSASAVVVSTVKGPPYGDAFPRDSQVPAKIYTQPQPRPQLQNSTAKDSVKLDFENRAAALETENVTCKALVEKLKKDLECEQREHRETRAKLTTSEKERKNAEENLELLRQYYENEYNKVNSDLKDEKAAHLKTKCELNTLAELKSVVKAQATQITSWERRVLQIGAMLCKTEGTITTLQKEKKQLETLVQNLSNKFDTLTQGLVDVLTAKREPSPTLLFAQELTTEPTAPQTPQLQLRTPQPQPTPQSQPQPQPQTQTPELSTKPQAQLVEEVPAIPQIPQVQQTQRDQPALTPERPIQRPNSPPPLPQSPQPQPQQQQSSQPLFQQKLHQQEPQNQSQSSVQPSNPLAALEKPPQQISSSELPPLSVIIFSDSTLRCLALFCSQLRACLPRVEITVGCRDQNIVEQVSKNSLCIYIEDFENASLNFGPVFNSLFSSCQDKLIIVLMRHHHQTLSFLPLPKPVWALIHSTTQKKMLSLCYYETSPGGDYSLQDNSDSEISAFASELSKKE